MIYGYGRVSTDDQSLSSDNQRQTLLAHAKDKGYELAHVFIDEDVSGGMPIRARPEGDKMFTVLRPGDRIVITKLDRGFRDTIDALLTVRDLRQMKVEVSFLDLQIDTSTSMGWTMLGMMALGAEMERNRISERVRDAWGYLRRNDKPYASTRPYGWERVGRGKDAEWVQHEPERKLAARILQMRNDGMTWEKIACRLAAQGVEKPRARKGARLCYYPSDVRGLALAAADGFPRRPQAAAPGSGRARKRL